MLDAEKTIVLRGEKAITKAALEFIANAKKRIDICGSWLAPHSMVGIPQFKTALLHAIAKGVEYRHLTEITEGNLVYCKELQKYAELRHLDGIKGNFGVHESEYIAITLLSEESNPVPELISSFAKSLVDDQQYLFEMLWNKAMPADHRIREIEEGIREIEEGITPPVTKIINSPQDIASRARQVIETSDRLCVCSDFGGLIMIERIAYDHLRRVLEKVQRGEHKGVRWIGTINGEEDVHVVQRFLELGMEIKHIRSTPLNFSVTDKEFSFTVSNMKHGTIASSVLISSEQQYITQFNSLFEQLWSQGIDAADRIREIEEGIESSKIEVIINPKKTQQLYHDLVNSANEEVLLILPTVKAFLREINIGTTRVLCNLAAKRDIKVMLLSPFDAKIKKELAQLEEGVAIQPNQKSSRSIFALLIVDKKNSLIIEVKDDSASDFQKAMGLATFSNSKPTVEPLVAIFENLWNQAELYEQLRISNEKLALRDKMQEEFINIAAHELRTPVQPILSMAELKAYDLAPEKESITMTKDEIGIIIRNAHRLERLSSDILEIARIESGNFQLNIGEFDLDDVISPLVQDAKDEIRSYDKDIQIYYSSFSILLRGDKERLAEVVWNLLENAVKFTKKGPIYIATKRMDDSHVIVTIKDSGTGIEPEVLPTLFAKFVTRSEKGTGLGLFISKNIIGSHGGSIWGENNSDGKGAIFTFTLPLKNMSP